MIYFKSGVTVHSASLKRYQVINILSVADQVAPKGYDLTVTSGCDGRHTTNSAHYTGKAFDLRTRDLEPNIAKKWCDRIRDALGSQYFVLLESDHIHIQFNGQ